MRINTFALNPQIRQDFQTHVDLRGSFKCRIQLKVFRFGIENFSFPTYNGLYLRQHLKWDYSIVNFIQIQETSKRPWLHMMKMSIYFVINRKTSFQPAVLSSSFKIIFAAGKFVIFSCCAELQIFHARKIWRIFYIRLEPIGTKDATTIFPPNKTNLYSFYQAHRAHTFTYIGSHRIEHRTWTCCGCLKKLNGIPMLSWINQFGNDYYSCQLSLQRKLWHILSHKLCYLLLFLLFVACKSAWINIPPTIVTIILFCVACHLRE